MIEKRFHYDWKTGRMRDTQSNSQATSDMRILETIINDTCYSYEKKISALEQENKQLKKKLLRKSREIEILKQGKYIYGVHGGSNDK